MHDRDQRRRADDVLFPRYEQHRDARLREFPRRPGRRASLDALQGYGVEACDLQIEERLLRLPLADPRTQHPLELRQVTRAGIGAGKRGGMRLGQADASQRVGVRQCPHALGVPARERGAGCAAHRLADERGRLELQRIEEPQQVIQIARLANALDVFGVAERAVIDGNGGVVLREARHLVEPAGVVTADAVREHHGGAFPAQFVVELAVPGGDVWHLRPGAVTARKSLPKTCGLYTAYSEALANGRCSALRAACGDGQKRSASSVMYSIIAWRAPLASRAWTALSTLPSCRAAMARFSGTRNRLLRAKTNWSCSSPEQRASVALRHMERSVLANW